MSKSPKDRAENLREALRIMASIIGDGRFDWTLFEPEDALFNDILATTWEELEESGYVKRMSNWDYRLTPTGWIRALDAAGTLADITFKENLGKLCAAIKCRC